MAETSQSAMGPYLAMAAAGSMSNSLAALFSQYELFKTKPGGDEGGGGIEDGGGGEGAAVRRSTGSHCGG